MPKIYNKSLELKKDISDKKFSIPITIEVTGNNLESIIVTAIEGGITYWSELQNDTEEFAELNDSGLCTSEKVFHILMNNKSVKFLDAESKDEEFFELTLEKLLNGIKLNMLHRPFDCDLNNMDATTADCIIQFALFSEVVYC